jgi:hypothetical protein
MTASVSHLIASMGLRAPRVALLVPGSGDWKLMVRAGIHAATTMWGGAGFIVVPVPSGDVHPAVIAAVRAYDPDSIVVPQGNTIVTRDEYPQLQAAQSVLSRACANYRSPTATQDDEFVASPNAGRLWASFFSTSAPGAVTDLKDVLPSTEGAETVGANPALGGALGVHAAARWGLSDPPSPESGEIDAHLRNRAIFELLSRRESVFGSLEGVTTRDRAIGDFKTDFGRTLFGLDSVYELGPETPPALLVWGDDPADFALAMAWDRTYGNGIWVPDEWWRDADTRNQVVTGIDGLATRLVGWQQRELAFTSTSLTRAELETRVEDCRIGALRSLTEPLIPAVDDIIVFPAAAMNWPRYYKVHCVIRGKQINQWSTAVREDDGTIEFAMLPPLPQIALPGLESIEQKAKWQVDVTVGGHEIPCTTAVPDRTLLAADENVYSTRVRSGRSGISFESHNSFFIPASPSIEQLLRRPHLRYPSLLKWAEARAGVHGMTVKLSTAGAHAQVLAKMLGGRPQLSALISGPLLPALHAFNRKGATRDAFPNEEGCVVRNEGFLHFAGMCSLAGIDPDSTARDTIDRLLSVGILRRGLLVDCPACTHVDFLPIEEVSTTVRCQRCLNESFLTRERWRHPVEEPQWFYDLHLIARALLRENGHVPLLLSQYLKGKSDRTFTDAPEFELMVSGKPEAETDLLALADRQLMVSEAKCTNTFGNDKRDGARKRVLAAHALVADEIVLATTQDNWETATLGAMKSAIRDETWQSGSTPRLRIISKLGAPQVSDTVETT